MPAIAIQRLSPSTSRNINSNKEIAESPDILSSTDSEIESPELDKIIASELPMIQKPSIQLMPLTSDVSPPPVVA